MCIRDRVQENDYVRAGTPLSDGAITPADILDIKGPTAVQEYICLLYTSTKQQSGSAEPNRKKVAEITWEQVRTIAQDKICLLYTSMVTLWPTDTWSPISMVDFSYKVCSTLPSWMFTPFPMQDRPLKSPPEQLPEQSE